MGFITKEQLAERKIQYVGINRDTGEFELSDKSLHPGIEGFLLGFDTHEFEYKGKMQKKFDVYLRDGALYQLQFGFYSWQTFKLMNSLLNVETLGEGGPLLITSGFEKDNFYINIEFDGAKIKWKYSYEDLKLKDLSKEAKEERRNKIIDKWYTDLMKVKPYIPESPVDTDFSDAKEPEDDDKF